MEDSFYNSDNYVLRYEYIWTIRFELVGNPFLYLSFLPSFGFRTVNGHGYIS